MFKSVKKYTFCNEPASRLRVVLYALQEPRQIRRKRLPKVSQEEHKVDWWAILVKLSTGVGYPNAKMAQPMLSAVNKTTPQVSPRLADRSRAFFQHVFPTHRE